VGHLTDVWSFCVVLYEAVAGRTPFKGANYNALLRQIVEDTPPTLRELAAADDELSAIVARGLSKQPEQRFASMGELGRALAQWLLQHGVTEDICGSTLEAKWLRTADPSGRAGRATLASISDAWSSESGSGVRRNVHQVNTIPAPSRDGTPAPATARAPDRAAVSEAAPASKQRPDARPKWQLFAGVAGLLLLAATGFGLAMRVLTSSVPAPSAAPASSSAAEPSAPSVPPEAPSAAPAAPSLEADEKRAQPVPEKVSSAVGRASGAVRVARPAPVPAKKGTGSRQAKAKPGDLISPY
jgi:serine/threonine-protein kinase